MPERRSCPAGHDYWFPGERWQHEKCGVVNHQESVTTTTNVVVNASNVVVNERTKDRHKKTPERLEYVKQKMREYRKRRA
jgi:hypothetical protein